MAVTKLGLKMAPPPFDRVVDVGELGDRRRHVGQLPDCRLVRGRVAVRTRSMLNMDFCHF